MRKYVPAYEGNLRKHALSVPRCISECSGIRVFGRRIKSLVFSTDVAIIKNINADAIIAVYPFTPQPAITQAIIGVSDVPVFCGVGGGLTTGIRSASMAAYVEHQGAYGVVCNSKIGLETIRDIKSAVEIPVVYTVISEKMDIQPYLDAGVDILNVSVPRRRSWRRCGRGTRTWPSSPPAAPLTRAFWPPLGRVPTPSPIRRPAARRCLPRPWRTTAASWNKRQKRNGTSHEVPFLFCRRIQLVTGRDRRGIWRPPPAPDAPHPR